jgi:hypothetical protein
MPMDVYLCKLICYHGGGRKPHIKTAVALKLVTQPPVKMSAVNIVQLNTLPSSANLLKLV